MKPNELVIVPIALVIFGPNMVNADLTYALPSCSFNGSLEP